MYRSVWVSFLYTAVDSWSLLRVTRTSRNASLPSSTFSIVNWMLVDRHLVEVCMEGLQFLFSMGPDDKGIVNIPQPEAGLEWGRVHGLFLQIFHEEVGDDGG